MNKSPCIGCENAHLSKLHPPCAGCARIAAVQAVDIRLADADPAYRTAMAARRGADADWSYPRENLEAPPLKFINKPSRSYSTAARVLLFLAERAMASDGLALPSWQDSLVEAEFAYQDAQALAPENPEFPEKLREAALHLVRGIAALEKGGNDAELP